MPITNEVYESLPYVDSEPSPAERAAAQQLIDNELDADTPQPHPSLTPSLPSNFTPRMELEFTRISKKEPLKAIDLSRYEALEPPATSPDSDEKSPETLTLWRSALERAYTSQIYLEQRQTNLILLDKYGKNGWLIGNSQLEDILRTLERDLAGRKIEIDEVVLERKTAQENVGPEVRGLEEGWRNGVGRVLETELAAEELRAQILTRRRDGAR